MADMIKADFEVIKTDGKGRVPMPTEQWEKLLEEFERSGLSGPQFAAMVGVKYQTLAGLGAEATSALSGKGGCAGAAGVRLPLAGSGSGRNSCLRLFDLEASLRRKPGSGRVKQAGLAARPV